MMSFPQYTPFFISAAAMNLLSCTPVTVTFDAICYTPFIYTTEVAPSELYTSDSPIITASLYTPCPSSTSAILTFPDYTSITPELPDYDATLDGVLLETTNNTNPFTYTSPSLPLSFFSPGFVRYEITAFSGYPLDEHSQTLNNYFTLSSDDTTSSFDTGFTYEKQK